MFTKKLALRPLTQVRQFCSTPYHLQNLYADHVLYTYDRFPIEIVTGEGCYLYDHTGRPFLDFGSGIAVNALGYNHPVWLEAVQKQASKLCHVSNLFYTEEQAELALLLTYNSRFDKAFFCNSGTEANEAAIKFCRRYSRAVHQNEAKTNIVTFKGSFHGRTMGALSVTSNEKYRQPFEPLIPGVGFGEFNRIEDLNNIIDEYTCGILVEPIQGEGGVHPARQEFLQALRARATEVGAVLVFDEVQCGVGRTGSLWAHEIYNVYPDMMTLAKPLAGGLPIGAVLLQDHIAETIKPGDHGTTFGGNAFVCGVAAETFKFINNPAFLDQVNTSGWHLIYSLKRMQEKLPHCIKDIRSIGGLMCGVELSQSVKPILAECRDRGIIFLAAGENVIRIIPPLTISTSELQHGMDILEEVLEKHANVTV